MTILRAYIPDGFQDVEIGCVVVPDDTVADVIKNLYITCSDPDLCIHAFPVLTVEELKQQLQQETV